MAVIFMILTLFCWTSKSESDMDGMTNLVEDQNQKNEIEYKGDWFWPPQARLLSRKAAPWTNDTVLMVLRIVFFTALTSDLVILMINCGPDPGLLKYLTIWGLILT